MDMCGFAFVYDRWIFDTKKIQCAYYLAHTNVQALGTLHFLGIKNPSIVYKSKKLHMFFNGQYVENVLEPTAKFEQKNG